MKETSPHRHRVIKVSVSSKKLSEEALSSFLVTRGFEAESSATSQSLICKGAVPKSGNKTLLIIDGEYSSWFKVERLDGKVQLVAGPMPQVKREGDRLIIKGTVHSRLSEDEWTIICDSREYGTEPVEVPAKRPKPPVYVPPPKQLVIPPVSPVVNKTPAVQPPATPPPIVKVAPAAQLVKQPVPAVEEERYVTIKVKVREVQVFGTQPRKYFDPAKMAALVDSIKEFGIIEPCKVRPLPPGSSHLYELIDGERRWRAIQIIGVDEVPVTIDRAEMTEFKQFLRSFAVNQAREEHTLREKSNAVKRMRDEGMSFEQAGVVIGGTASWARQLHSLQRLHPELLPLLDPPTPKDQRLGWSEALVLIQIDQEKQLEAYNEAKSAGANPRGVLALLRQQIFATNPKTRTTKDSYRRDEFRILQRFINGVDADLIRLQDASSRLGHFLKNHRGEETRKATCLQLRGLAKIITMLADNIETAATNTEISESSPIVQFQRNELRSEQAITSI